MVSHLRNQRGASGAGCLVSLVLFAVICYYGWHIGGVYWKFYQMQDAMTSQARLAPSLTDAVIQRRLAESTDEILLPDKPLRFKIKRTPRPAKITIDTEYTDSLKLPFFERKFTFKPHAEAAL